MNLTEELIKKLIGTDTLLERNAKMLSNPTKWQLSAKSENVLWGLCKSMGSEFYQVKFDLISEKSDCNCPDSKKPCKHIVALLLLDLANSLEENKFPDWVTNWISKVRISNLETIVSDEKEKVNSEIEKESAANKRALERKELMSSGIDELDLWLTDLVRQGFANVDIQNQEFWERAAARFKDAKLSKVAFMLRSTGVMIRENKDWPDLLCSTIGELALLVQAFKNIDKHSPDFQEEIYNAVGRIVKKSDLIDSQNFIIDNWTVLGIREEISIDSILERRVWVQGQKSGSTALIQDFAFPPGTAFEHQYIIGKSYHGRLVFYPASLKQRAILLHSGNNENLQNQSIKGFENFDSMLMDFAKKISLNPWLRINCYVVKNISLFLDENGKYSLVDENNQLIALKNELSECWKFLSLSNAQPITVVVEWDGLSLEILSIQ